MVEGCFHEWLMDGTVKKFRAFPILFVYLIWCVHNFSTFQYKLIPSAIVTNLVIKATLEFQTCAKKKKTRLMEMSNLRYKIPWGYFNGESKGPHNLCGARVVLFFSKRMCFSFMFVAGRGYNNRVELYALWILLRSYHRHVYDKI